MVSGNVTSNANDTNRHDSKFDDIVKTLEDFKKIDVLVGIPDYTTNRPPQKGDKITNAQLAFIHTHGVRNIAMRQEMQSNMDAGKTYHKAHEMYLQAHGSPLLNVPPRPIIEPAIEDDKILISQILGEAMTAFLDGDLQLGNEKLNHAGLEAQTACQDWFDNDGKNGWQENSPATKAIKLKKRGTEPKPLIDTGELRKSITYVIRKGT